MIDKRAYCEMFSRLNASLEAKEEVFHMMETKKCTRRLPKLLRTIAIAAAMTAALAVTAGAVNIATDGAIFHKFLITWIADDDMIAVDDEGNRVFVTAFDEEELVTKEDGRLILHADQEIDITDELSAQGSYHYEYEDVITWDDGSETTQTITIDVTGDLESWTATRSNGSNVTCTIDTRESEGNMSVTREARPSEAATDGAD